MQAALYCGGPSLQLSRAQGEGGPVTHNPPKVDKEKLQKINKPKPQKKKQNQSIRNIIWKGDPSRLTTHPK